MNLKGTQVMVRILFSTMSLDGTQIMLNKITKKLYYVESYALRLVGELLPNTYMQWAPDGIQTGQDAYAELISRH